MEKSLIKSNQNNSLSVKIFRYLPALKYRNFNLLFYGQSISLIGTWMQTTAQSWLVLELTNSPFLLGLLGAVQFLPMMFFSFFAGVVADRFSKRKILLITQSVLTLLALALAVLSQIHIVEFWHVLVIGFFSGVANALDMPTRQSFFSEVVEKPALMNAISLNSSIFNLARIIGPAVAGISIAKLGYAFCFYANAASFLPVIIGLSMIRTPKREGAIKGLREDVFKEIKEGIHYAFDKQIILLPLFLLLIVNIFALNFNVLVPVFVKEVLKRSADTYGNILSIMGIGAILGSTLLAVTSHRGVKDYYIFGGATMLGASLVLFSFQERLFLTYLFIAFSGFMMVVFLNSINTTLQVNSEDGIRGRVMSFYSFVFGGLTPLGALYAGSISEKFGASFSFRFSGLLVFSATILIYLFWYRKVFGNLFKREEEITEAISSAPVNQVKK